MDKKKNVNGSSLSRFISSSIFIVFEVLFNLFEPFVIRLLTKKSMLEGMSIKGDRWCLVLNVIKKMIKLIKYGNFYKP